MNDIRDLEKSRDQYPPGSLDIHGPVYPADIRPEDRIAARLKISELDSYESCRVWRLSPFGIELLIASFNTPVKGTQLDLELSISGRVTNFRGLVVDLIPSRSNDAEVLIGIRFVSTPERENKENQQSTPERRLNQRWLCSEQFYPTCVAPTPGRMNDYIYFRIYDISQTGMKMKCSLRNKHLLPNTRLELFAQFPGCENAHIDVTIKRIGIGEEGGKDVLELGVEFDNLSKQTKQSIGQYLLQFNAATDPASISQSGFKTSSVAKAADFYFLKSEEDYRQVLELRLAAHRTEGNLGGEAVTEDMGDVNDSRSRIIIGKINGAVVATARLRYNDSKTPLEHEAFVEWPSHLPRRDQIVEVSRACTHPDYRGSDLFYALLQFIASYTLQRQRPYLVIGSWPSMISYYKKCGFRETGISHEEPQWNKKQHILCSNFHETVLGKNTHPVYWNYLYKDVARDAIEFGILNPNELDRLRMSTYEKLSWLTKLKFRKPRKR